MNHNQKAQDKFFDEYACSQAILSEYCNYYDVDSQVALKISAGFAGGMCMGKTCGAVTGAIMVLGLKFAGQQPETPEGRKSVKEAVLKFTELFKSLNGSTECKDLLSVDISTPLGLQTAKEKNVFRTVCPKFIKDSASILEQIINDGKSDSRVKESNSTVPALGQDMGQ